MTNAYVDVAILRAPDDGRIDHGRFGGLDLDWSMHGVASIRRMNKGVV
jgi:hypothetical protein